MFKFLHHNKPAKLLFENEYDKVISTRHLPTKLLGQPVDYHKIAHDYMPKGYRFVSHDPLNNSVIKSGANEVIYVKKAGKDKKTGSKRPKEKAKAQSTPKIGEIMVRYQLGGDSNHVVRQQITRQPVGNRFSADYYVKNVPVGYQFKQLLKGQRPVSKFTAKLQHVNIAVVPAKKKPAQRPQQPKASKSAKPKSQRPQPAHQAIKHVPVHQHRPAKQITDGVLYQNVVDGNIESTAKISGPRGMRIDYAPYIHRDSKHMPAGFHFDHLAAGTSHVLRPHTSYTILIKKDSPVQSQATKPTQKTASASDSQSVKDNRKTNDQTPREVQGVLTYQDADTHQVIKSIPIQGRQGTPVNYGKYMMADQLPAQHHLTGLGAQSSDRFKPNAHYVILVTRNRTPKPKKPHYAPIVNGTVDYRDAKTRQVIDVQQISGPVGLSLDYQRYMPRGYRFLKLSSNTGNYLTRNMHGTVWITRKAAANTNKRTRPSKAVNHGNGPEAAFQDHNVNHVNANHQSSQSAGGHQANHAANVPKGRQKNPRVLPQDPDKAVNIGTILENLGKSLSALGRAIDHHQL